MRHKLYLQIYFAFLGGLILFALLAGLAWKTLSEGNEPARFKAGLSLLVSQSLPINESPELLQPRLQGLAKTFEVTLSLYNRDSKHVVSTGSPLPLPKSRHNWGHDHDRDNFSLRLDDGRWLVVSHQSGHFPMPLLVIVLLFAVLGIAAYPIAKRLTCRLEQLQTQVDAFGQGNLKARASITGKDEIAILAKRFNHTAERIEKLIEAQKHILSGASHELRSPLTRMRMAIELMQSDSIESSKTKLEADIAELDDLVDELLLASKLDAGSAGTQFEKIDLLALAAEVASIYDAEVSGDQISIMGDETMLRRLLRNLLQNAQRYAVEKQITVFVSDNSESATIKVCDDGPGIPEAERIDIFEPFYQPRIDGHSQGSIGLGLSLVRKIAMQHGGDVNYIDGQSGGACFEVTIKRGIYD
ncbi:HAMP domain-containing histidine kinase [Mariprofundus sp. NF]|uniref:sensor histidine kinase n=1 Tax=Mariprofundus sp. NF TaxID=2608716 RepID=UPI0015A3CC52|nr:HAMP domain-containing sensor histidine kinase [Mariprofundus sp. NF]NWF39771.1 HAMP domain-containing histidine kinase [Mariprofundus sp. NF]